MKVLVTGGAGFIGSHLAEALLKRGEMVVVIDDFNDFYDPAIKRENVSGFKDNPLCKIYEADIRDSKLVQRIILSEKPNVVCHLAARAGVRPSIENPILYEETNSIGTLNILSAIRELNIKNFVFASSSSVYGINDKTPFSEDDPATLPISPYAVTKRACELMLFAYSRLYLNIPVTCLRLFTVYGERGRPDMAVARFTKFILEGKPLPIYGNGSQKRDFTCISDIIKGIISAIDNPFAYEIINLGGGCPIKVLRLISIIEAGLGRKAKIDYRERQPGDVDITSADITKARRLLSYKPSVSIEEGIENYLKWFLTGRKS